MCVCYVVISNRNVASFYVMAIRDTFCLSLHLCHCKGSHFPGLTMRTRSFSFSPRPASSEIDFHVRLRDGVHSIYMCVFLHR